MTSFHFIPFLSKFFHITQVIKLNDALLSHTLPPKYVCILISGTCDYELTWKKSLKDLEMRRSSWFIWVAVNPTTNVLSETQRRHREEEKAMQPGRQRLEPCGPKSRGAGSRQQLGETTLS